MLTKLKTTAATVAVLLFLAVCNPASAHAANLSIWGNATPATPSLSWDAKSIELGTRFNVSQPAQAVGVRFFKGTGNTGTHRGYLYSGQSLVATAAFNNETDGGWQVASFTTPVQLVVGTTYTVSYLAPNGHYANDDPWRQWPAKSGLITATGATYRYGTGGVYPTPIVPDENYYADVIVATGTSTSTTPTVAPPPTTTRTTAPPTTTRTTAPTTTPTTTAPPTTTTGSTAAPSSCPSATANVPDGPDGKGGCWPGPATTGPNPAPGAIYPAPSGSRYVFDADTVIDGKIVNGDMLIRKGTVTLRNSVMNGTVEVQAPGAIVVDKSEVRGGDWVGATFAGPNITIQNSEITGTPTVVNCSGNCQMTNTYSHDPWYFTDWDQHSSAFATNGGTGMTVRHNTVWCNIKVNPVGGGCTGDLALQSDFANVVNVTIDRNLFPVTPSGSYCITLGYWPTKPYKNPSGIVVTNNVFGKGSNGRCGVYGTSDAYSASAPGNVWSGNVFSDGTIANPNS